MSRTVSRPKENQYFRFVKPDLIEIQLKSLPEVSGVYQYYDKSDRIIYVGKAKILRKELVPILIKFMNIKKRMFL